MKFNINDYQGRYVMHCDTEDKAETFCNYLNSILKKWDSYHSYKEITLWNVFEAETCYNFNTGQFACYRDYEENDYTILEFDDFEW